MKKHGKLPKKLQEIYDKQDYFCPPNHKMVKSTIVPDLKVVDMKASILRDIADKLVELADMLDSKVRQ